MAIEGDRLLISAPYEDSDNGSQSGVVYVYKVTADGKVSLQERLTHPNGKANDEFGRSIGLSGQNILVGAPGTTLAMNVGMVEVPFSFAPVSKRIFLRII